MSPRIGGMLWNTAFLWTQDGYCTYGHTETLVLCTIQSQLKFQHGYISSSEALALAEELLTLNGRWEGAESFSFGSVTTGKL